MYSNVVPYRKSSFRPRWLSQHLQHGQREWSHVRQRRSDGTTDERAIVVLLTVVEQHCRAAARRSNSPQVIQGLGGAAVQLGDLFSK
jgi:hypothetical protein